MNVVEKILKRTHFSVTELSNQLGITLQALTQWRNRNKIPAAKIPRICEISGLMPWEVCEDYDLERIYKAKAFFDLLEKDE